MENSFDAEHGPALRTAGAVDGTRSSLGKGVLRSINPNVQVGLRDMSLHESKDGEKGGDTVDDRHDDAANGICSRCNRQGHDMLQCLQTLSTMICNLCHKEGHFRKDCPDKTPVICPICKEDGHYAASCKNNHKLDLSAYPDMEVDPAYDAMIQATKKYNKDNVVKAIKTYLKCKPDTTYVEIEKAIIATGGVMHVIAVDRKLEPQYTFVSLQGKPGCKYEAQIHPFEQPRRKGQKLSWPKNRQENLDRLKKAGDLGVTSEMICSACNERGHHFKQCTVPKEAELIQPTCKNCSMVGHRYRDCTRPRKMINGREPMVCRNCEEPGHKAADCTEEHAPRNIECRNCGEMGHMSKECSKERRTKCRNCDEWDHMSKECPQPTDWSRVTCRNCGEKGHTVRRCTMPIEETPMDAENAAGGSMIYDNSTSAGFGDDQGAAQSYSGFANEVEEPPPGFEESFVRSNNGAGLEENHTSTDAQYPTTNGDGAVGTFEDAAPEKVVEEEVDGW